MPISDCLPIVIEKIRARIVINNYIVETPYVKSFNVTKSRASLTNTFSASIEIPINANLGDIGNGYVAIFSGTKENYLNEPIFTGVIKQTTINPLIGKPNYILLNFSGSDVTYKLENKRFSRRLQREGPGLFVTIEGSKGERPTAIWSIDKPIKDGKNVYTATSPLPSDKGQHNTLRKVEENSSTTVKSSEAISNNRNAGNTIPVHSHDSMNTGGSSFGRFAIPS
jgi:hypothetical protein